MQAFTTTIAITETAIMLTLQAVALTEQEIGRKSGIRITILI